jgi:hypothetical protein
LFVLSSTIILLTCFAFVSMLVDKATGRRRHFNQYKCCCSSMPSSDPATRSYLWHSDWERTTMDGTSYESTPTTDSFSIGYNSTRCCWRSILLSNPRSQRRRSHITELDSSCFGRSDEGEQCCGEPKDKPWRCFTWKSRRIA